MVIEQFVPFVNNYDFFDKMGVKIYPNGHSYTGRTLLDPFEVLAIGDYERRMTEAYGAERAQRILGEVRHNTVYYPNLTIKGAIQAIRVARPIAPDTHAASRAGRSGWPVRRMSCCGGPRSTRG